MKRRIIIEIENENISDLAALNRVMRVMGEGQISEASTGAHYCWHVEFSDGVSVSVRRKRSKDSADSFVVR